MTINAVTHLNFRGDARNALAFYHSVFGGDKTVVSYKDAGNIQNPAEADQVIWGQMVAESGFRVMAYDVPSSMPWNPGQIPFFISVRGDNTHEITSYWEKLSDGATVLQPLASSAWSPLYGMLKDRFGITWVLDVESGLRPDYQAGGVEYPSRTSGVYAEFCQPLEAALFDLIEFCQRFFNIAAFLAQFAALFFNAFHHQMNLSKLTGW